MQATIPWLTDEVGEKAFTAENTEHTEEGLVMYSVASASRLGGGGEVVARVPGVTVETVIGRTLAYCLHPAAAWRVVSARGRAAIVGAYATAGYAAVLAALLLR